MSEHWSHYCWDTVGQCHGFSMGVIQWLKGNVVAIAIAIPIPIPILFPSPTQATPTPSLLAQVIPDSTLPNPSIVTSNGDDSLQSITGGTLSGNSLFHSFQEFSISENQIIQFQNDTALNHIITRVTGTTPSSINGRLETQGTADFFLLNPNGIVFGPSAELNIGGSLIASTADRLLFDNGTDFSAVDPQAPPLLTVSTPIGLQYGNNPGSIQVQGNGNQLTVDADTLAIVTTNRPVGLQVPNGKTLALVGGDLQLTGGNVTARDGRVALGAVGANQTVTLIGDALGWALAYDEVSASGFQEIQLTDAASVLTSGIQGGAIQVRGNNLSLLAGSTLLANTLGDGVGQGIEVTVSDRIRVSGTASITLETTTLETTTTESLAFPSSILAEVTREDENSEGTGNGGSISLTADRLTVTDLGQISTTTFGSGNAGDLSIRANQITLTGATPDSASGLFTSVVGETTTGQGGQLQIETDRLVVRDGAQIQASTFSPGNGGSIQIAADVLRIIGVDDSGDPSGILAQTEGTGQAGDIDIRGDRLQILDGGIISTSTFSPGAGGTLRLTVDDIALGSLTELGTTDTRSSILAITQGGGAGGNIVIASDMRSNQGNQRLRVLDGSLISTNTFGNDDGTFARGDGGSIQIITGTLELNGTNADGQESEISSAVQSDSLGQGGQISIQAEQLQATDAQINVSTFGPGNAGQLQLNINDIQLVGQLGANTGIFTTVQPFADGNGGLLAINADRLVVQNSAQVVSATAGSGSAGPLRIVADDVILDGRTEAAASGIFASAILEDGTGGNIDLIVDQLSLSNGATISASNFFSGTADIPPGQGAAGSLTLQAREIRLRDSSVITTSTNSGERGNIQVQSDRLFLTGQSRIETNANTTEGGNISITSDIAIALENSDITANALAAARGGQVLITAEVLLGARVRDRLTRFSDITATSGDPSLNGIVTIDAPDPDFQPEEGNLPSTTVDVEQLIAQSCIPPRNQGRFLIIGGDLPPNPPTAPSTFGFDTYSLDDSPWGRIDDNHPVSEFLTAMELSPALSALILGDRELENMQFGISFDCHRK